MTDSASTDNGPSTGSSSDEEGQAAADSSGRPSIDEIDADAAATARSRATSADRIVVKAGTNTLTDDDSKLDLERVDKLVDDLNDLLERDREVLFVSSGAIGAGKGRIEYPDDTVEESQALSTVGQSQLMARYADSFDRHDRTVAQILLTENDLEDTERFTNFTNTVETLLEWDVVPIINENDAVATEEIRIGDNDMLSASVAIGVGADLLVTLTDVGGVYTANPKEDDDAELIEAVGTNFDAVLDLVDRSSEDAFGGIRTKVQGAREVSEHDIPAIIAGGAEEDVLERIVTGKAVGTIFVPTNGESPE